VQNGEEAVSKIRERKFDLVLMDIKMPIMSGIEASKRIKKIYPKLPIIAQTAYAYKNEIDEILKCGISAYIIKPINRAELFAVIEKYLPSFRS
jgi:CheY-like chemotaxis protein